MDDARTLAESAAEAAMVKMAIRALLHRAAADDAFVIGIRVELDRGDEVNVELLDANGTPVGGFSL